MEVARRESAPDDLFHPASSPVIQGVGYTCQDHSSLQLINVHRRWRRDQSCELVGVTCTSPYSHLILIDDVIAHAWSPDPNGIIALFLEAWNYSNDPNGIIALFLEAGLELFIYTLDIP